MSVLRVDVEMLGQTEWLESPHSEQIITRSGWTTLVMLVNVSNTSLVSI